MTAKFIKVQMNWNQLLINPQRVQTFKELALELPMFTQMGKTILEEEILWTILRFSLKNARTAQVCVKGDWHLTPEWVKEIFIHFFIANQHYVACIYFPIALCEPKVSYQRHLINGIRAELLLYLYLHQ